MQIKLNSLPQLQKQRISFISERLDSPLITFILNLEEISGLNSSIQINNHGKSYQASPVFC